MTNKQVLIVEDDPLVRLVAFDALEDAGFAVVEAGTAKEALEVLRRRDDIAVIFTDINMPGPFDGLDLAKLVGRRWPEIKLIVTSGRPPERAMPGHVYFLPKPYSLQQVAGLIAEL